jgi:hypothetical protein
MRKAPLAIALLSGLAAAVLWISLPSGGEIQAADPSLERCPYQFEDFKDFVVWQDSRNRVLIQARSACGRKYGQVYDLEDVNVRIESDGKPYAEWHSESGAYAPARGSLLLDRPVQASASSCLGGFDVLSLNIRSGVFRAPGVLMNIESGKSMNCRSHG